VVHWWLRGEFLGSIAFGYRSPPEILKPRRVGGRVLNGVLNVPVSKIVLHEPRIRALVGQCEAARVAQHVRMGKQGQGSGDRSNV